MSPEGRPGKTIPKLGGEKTEVSRPRKKRAHRDKRGDTKVGTEEKS